MRVSLEEAYKNLIMVGKYPACVLMLDVPPATVDVNVHPAKAEVRFSDEKIVFNCVYFAVKNALMASGLIYEFQMKEEKNGIVDYKAKPFEPEKFEQPKIPEKTENTMSVRSVSNSEYSAAYSSEKVKSDNTTAFHSEIINLSSRKMI